MTEIQHEPFLRVPAIRVDQPLGEFYAAAIPANKLLQVCYTDRLTAIRHGNTYRLHGSQRSVAESRLKEIGRYINTTESAFPNSIILAANYDKINGLIVEDATHRWRIETHEHNGDLFELVIPTGNPLAPIIDGQHRLFGFTTAREERLAVPVLCSIFIDLPRPYQAHLFATINSTQKAVDRSQTYELFGYNIEEEDPATWSPEKLAVFLCRKLNTDVNSPLADRILVAAANDFAISRAEAKSRDRWMVSTATIVDGITRLISSSPKKDADALRTGSNHIRSRLSRINRTDNSPLRDLYLATRDQVLMKAVWNFFESLQLVLPTGASTGSYLTKTVGIQALFDVLRLLSPMALTDKDFSRDWFDARLNGIEDIDFSHQEFQQASGQGRTLIRNAILVHLGIPYSRLNESKRATIRAVLERTMKR